MGYHGGLDCRVHSVLLLGVAAKSIQEARDCVDERHRRVKCPSKWAVLAAVLEF